GTTYGLDADSTIWTGHYLAAEAFRYAATGGGQGLDRINALLAGLTRDLDVADAVVESGKVSAAQRGFLARATLPEDDPHGLTDGSFTKRGCYYVHPSGGWQVNSTKKKFPTYALAIHASGRSTGPTAVGKPTPGRRFDFGPVTPLGKLLYGFGCGSRA